MELIGTPPEIATQKAKAIKVAVDALSLMLPLEWTDPLGRHLVVQQTRIDEQRSAASLRVWFLISIDGAHINGDGWYGFENPPIYVHDGTYRTEIDAATGHIMLLPNFREDILASFFDIVDKAVC